MVNKSDWENCIYCDKLTSPRGKYWEGWHAICSQKCFKKHIDEESGN